MYTVELLQETFQYVNFWPYRRHNVHRCGQLAINMHVLTYVVCVCLRVGQDRTVSLAKQEGLAVASIARDDPSIGGGHVCWGSDVGFNFAGWRSAVFPACTATQCTSVTDRRTLTS